VPALGRFRLRAEKATPVEAPAVGTVAKGGSLNVEACCSERTALGPGALSFMFHNQREFRPRQQPDFSRTRGTLQQQYGCNGLSTRSPAAVRRSLIGFF